MNFSKSKLGGETETAVTPTESSEVHEEEGLEEIGHIKN